MMDIKSRVLLQWFINEINSSGGAVKNQNMSNRRPLDLAKRDLAEELHKPIIIKSEKRKVYSPFIDNG